MADVKRKPRMAAFLVLGCGLVAVGISTKNMGILGAGVMFIIIGAADAVKARRDRDADGSGDNQQ